MRSPRPRPSRCLALAAAVLAGPLVLTGTAGAQQAPPVSGVSTCDLETGAPTVEWTIANPAITFLTIESATVTGAIETTATFVPDVVDPAGTARAVTRAPVGTTGSISITVEAAWAEGELVTRVTAVGTATLGPCEVPSTSTSSTTTTPTHVVTVTPTFTG